MQVKKHVMLMSTIHGRVDIEQEEKRKSSMKFGVDAIDQMARNYTSRVAGRLWPLQVHVCVD